MLLPAAPGKDGHEWGAAARSAGTAEDGAAAVKPRTASFEARACSWALHAPGEHRPSAGHQDMSPSTCSNRAAVPRRQGMPHALKQHADEACNVHAKYHPKFMGLSSLIKPSLTLSCLTLTLPDPYLA